MEIVNSVAAEGEGRNRIVGDFSLPPPAWQPSEWRPGRMSRERPGSLASCRRRFQKVRLEPCETMKPLAESKRTPLRSGHFLRSHAAGDGLCSPDHELRFFVRRGDKRKEERVGESLDGRRVGIERGEHGRRGWLGTLVTCGGVPCWSQRTGSRPSVARSARQVTSLARIRTDALPCASGRSRFK